MSDNWEQVGAHDLRYDDTPAGGFHHVILRDADDGDTIVVNEDDLVALRDRLDRTIRVAGLEPSPARLTNLEVLCYALGWQGGTLADAAKTLGVAGELILTADAEVMGHLCRVAQLSRATASQSHGRDYPGGP